jgi:hypothetical protein
VTGAPLFSNDSLSLFFFFSVKRPVAGKIISLNLFFLLSIPTCVSWAELPRERRKTGKTGKN